MTFAQLVFHLANFALPALFLALWVPAAGHWLMGSARLAWRWRACWHALAGLLVLLAGLVLQGHDGQMATYAALVLVSASLEWALQRRGRA